MWSVLSKILKMEEKIPIVIIERRKHYRISVILTLVCRAAHHEEPFRIVTENIGIGGLKFFSTSRLREGDEIKMNFLLYSPCPSFDVRGKVIWCRQSTDGSRHGFEGGIDFLSINDEERGQLERYITKYCVD